MNRKKLFIIGICILIILFIIFLYRVSIYNYFNYKKYKNAIKSTNELDNIEYMDYQILIGYDEDLSESLYVYSKDKKIIYFGYNLNNISFSLGDKNYNICKVMELEDNDFYTIKKCANKKGIDFEKMKEGEDVEEGGAIITDVKNVKIRVLNKTDAKELYDILERIKK